MKNHHPRIIEPACCPQCGGRMTRYTNGQGRGWTMCVDCGAQIPTESGYREVKMEKTTGKIVLERAEKTAEAIVKRLAPYCKKRPDGTPYIVVAGSIRRRKPMVNDIDIVLVPADPWNLHQEILGLCRPFSPKASGRKIMRLEVNGIQVDLYFADEQTWATLLLIRTGSARNNIRLCSRAKEMGWHLAASGDGLFNEKGERIAGDSELSIYNTLGLLWQEPKERE